jgi:curli biogenesis system outer membrane secretion channel CsgG
MRTAIAASVATLVLSTSLLAQSAARPTVALRDFTFTAPLSSDMRNELNGLGGLAILLGRREDPRVEARNNAALVAQQFSGLLTDALTEEGTYLVLDRDNLSSVTDEQDLGASARAAAGQSTAKVGALRTAAFVLAGSITKYGKVEKRNGWGGVVGGVGGVILGGMSRGKTNYHVEVLVKVIDASSGAVVATVRTEGTSAGGQRLNVTGGGFLGAVVGGSINSSSTGDAELRIAEALAEASVLAASKLAQKRDVIIASRN